MDPEHCEVALKEIQFPYLWYNVRKDKNHFIGWYNTAIGRPSNKRVEFKFMKEIKPGYYSSMSEMVAKLNAKIPAEPRTIINLHSDDFDVSFDYEFFSNVSGVSIEMEESALLLGLKENENLHDPLHLRL